MYDHVLHRGRKYFCRYCLQAFRTVEKLKCHIKYCFKINGKQTIKMQKKNEYVKLKIYERKTKLPFMIYADFESILAPDDNGKQNPHDCYASKYQKYIAGSYGYKLVCVDNKFRKSFKIYLGEDAVFNFINSMIEESMYFSEIMKKHFNKKTVMTKKIMKTLRALLNVESVI